MNINRCPSTLTEGFTSYSPTALKNLFNGKKVSPFLPYDSPGIQTETEEFILNHQTISISGVQEKFSTLVENGVIRMAKKGEQSTHILKPVSTRLRNANDIPANEHLTMQIASQVFGIIAAANGLCFFKDGKAAYITKRFDIEPNGKKIIKEDFASLAGKTDHTGSANFKYDYSYLEMGDLIRQYIPSWRIELDRFYRLILFNYLFSNGDAHLKNFSVLRTSKGHIALAPAYDLLNTKLHVQDSPFALSDGLFKGAPTNIKRHVFIEFGKLLELPIRRIEEHITQLMSSTEKIEAMIANSYLTEPSKRAYLQHYRTRYNTLR